MIEKILPIGSVVKMKDSDKKMMITGILQVDEINKHGRYDYVGVLYPVGHVSRISNVGFDQNDIDEVVFRGYEDKEREDYLQLIEKIYKKCEESVKEQNE